VEKEILAQVFFIKTIKCWIKQNLNKDTVITAPTDIAVFNIDEFNSIIGFNSSQIIAITC